jgi:acetoin utilization deacetylase AcuC-like enzyme
VLTISLHTDPAFEFPYYSGYATETGAGNGLGFHHNFPLPAGTDDAAYLKTLAQAITLVREFAPAYLIVSAGMDIYEGDPPGRFKITREGIREIGHRIATFGLPTAIIMEGGYNTDALGENISAFLGEFIR